MKSKIANLAPLLALGLAGIAGAVEPAAAGGWDHAPGGLGQYRSSNAVPVPAPVPVADFGAKWYLRADVGMGYRQDRGGKESGIVYGATDYPTPFGTSSSWLRSDDDFGGVAGVGVGYYWSPRFRTDVTAEYVSASVLRMRGSYTYMRHDPDPFTGVLTPTTNRVDGSVEEKSSVTSGVFLFNGYFDLARRGAIATYAGAGLGFAYNHLERSHRTEETECDTAAFPPCGTSILRATWTDQGSTTNITLAAALTTGFTYNLSESTLLDVNYRLLYVGGSSMGLVINGNSSRMTMDDMFEHQLRAGLRWNLQ